MRRILELSASVLRTGEAKSAYDSKGGAWDGAVGLNPFISDDDYRFLLATTKAPIRRGESQITDVPIAFARDPRVGEGENGYILGLGAGEGRFYKVNTAGEVTVVRPQATLTTLANPTGGMASIIDSAGNPFLFLATYQGLVRWNFNTADSASHWNVGNNALNNAARYPFHRLFDSVYFGNGHQLGRIPLDAVHDQATAFSNIDFDAVKIGYNTEQITSLGDDGRYLIIATSYRSSFDDNDTPQARLLWYSGVGSNWEWETSISGERGIRAIIKNALGVFAIGEQSIYQIAFGQQPKLLRTFSTSDAIFFGDYLANAVGQATNLAAPFGDSMIFGRRGAVFGKRYPTEPVTFSHPLQGHTGDISLIIPDFKRGTVFVGTGDNKLWEYDMSLAGNAPTAEYRTRWFDLKDKYDIKAVEVELPKGLGASDVQALTVEVPSGAFKTQVIRQSTIDAKDRFFANLNISPELTGSKVRFTLTQTAGSPALGAIYLYGSAASK